MIKLVIGLSAIVFFIAGTASTDRQHGMPGRTNSPGEITCTQGGCHDEHIANSGTGSVSISWSGPSSWKYSPGATYIISIQVAQSGMPLFGFDFEALTDSGANGGTIALTDTNETQLWDITILQNMRVNVVHKFNAGLTANAHTFLFSWTAPQSGNISFYASGLAANHDSSTSGDYVYTTAQLLTPITSGICVGGFGGFGLEVFPTITDGNISLRYLLEKNYNLIKAECYSSSGNYINTLFAESETEGVQKKDISLPVNLAPGLYFIKMFGDNSLIEVKKIIIKK